MPSDPACEYVIVTIHFVTSTNQIGTRNYDMVEITNMHFEKS